MTKTRNKNLLVTAFAAVAFALIATILAAPPHAGAAGVNPVLVDCNLDYVIDGNWTKQQLLDAQQEMRSDLTEYSNCDDAIAAALAALITKKHGGKGKSGKAALKAASVNDLTTASQRRKLRARAKAEAKIDPENPLEDGKVNPAIKLAEGNTLASELAPKVPTTLIIAIFGLLLLFSAELVSRLNGGSRITPALQKLFRRGGS